jgi:hypothetical protein
VAVAASWAVVESSLPLELVGGVVVGSEEAMVGAMAVEMVSEADSVEVANTHPEALVAEAVAETGAGWVEGWGVAVAMWGEVDSKEAVGGSLR